jgi:hypothetical protein
LAKKKAPKLTKKERKKQEAALRKAAKKLRKKRAKFRAKQRMRRECHCRKCGSQYVGFITMDEICTPCLLAVTEELKAQKKRK